MNKPFKIRKAEEKDFQAMDEIFRTSAQALCADDYDREIIAAWTEKSRPERFEQSVEQGCELYVLVNSDEVICFGSLHIEKALLESLFVTPGFAGQGLGDVMMLYLINRAKDAGINRLQVNASLNAVGFYNKYGFVEQNKTKFTTESGVEMDTIVMFCNLKS